MITITIIGSYKQHLSRIMKAREDFEKLGAKVLRPRSGEVIESEDGQIRFLGDPENHREVRSEQFRAIRESDLIYLINPGGYIGPASTLDAGYAYRDRTPVFSSEMPFDEDVSYIIASHGSPEEVFSQYRESYSQ